MATPPPAGVYVPVPTFFVSRKAANYNPVAAPLDLATQAAHSIHLARSGIRGLVILGSTGEAVHLTNKERFEVLSSVRKALENAGFKDYPIIAGTAAQNIEEVVDQLKSAKEAGAQWGLCLVPGYFAGASTQEGIIQWFTAVADQSPIPVMMYLSCPRLLWEQRKLTSLPDITTPESPITSKSYLQPSPRCLNTPISLAANSLTAMSRIMLKLVQIPRLTMQNSIRSLVWASNYCRLYLWVVQEQLMALLDSSQNRLSSCTIYLLRTAPRRKR